MKEQKLYVCEYCNTQYSDKNRALECEQYHNTNLVIIKKHFKGGIPAPTMLDVEDKNTGTKFRYNFQKYL